MPPRNISRREALRILGWSTAALTSSSLLSCALRGLKKPTSAPDFGPLQRSPLTPGIFSGDDPHRGHRAFWDKRGYLAEKGGSWPAPSEETNLLIAGGGMSGLFTAYLLRDLNPVILEQASRFGGNAKAATWRGTNFSLGAAYSMRPSPGSPLAKIYEELGINGRDAPDGKPTLWRGKLGNLWQDEDLHCQAQLKNAEFLFRQIYEEKIPYPVIPPTNAAERKILRDYDKESFHQFLVRQLGPLSPKVERFFEFYSCSAAGASAHEISAALGVSFFAAEFDKVLVMPGGNAAIAEKLFERLQADLKPNSLRPSSLLVNLETRKDFSLATFEDSEGTLKTIRAKVVVMACPKFVVGKVMEDLEPSRVRAIASLKTYPYLVANVCLDKPAPEFYDAFLLGENGASDMVNANYAATPNTGSVLTLYRPLSYPSARAELLAPASHKKFEEEIRDQLENVILPQWGLSGKNIQEIYLTRWGHPLPVAPPGFYRRKLANSLRRPFKGHVFFVEQDNWACPALETCASEAFSFAPQIRELALSKFGVFAHHTRNSWLDGGPSGNNQI